MTSSPLVYDDLRRLARARLRAGGRNPLLDTSALVHESDLRFAAAARLELRDRTHFMRWAGRVMRSVIVDFARRQLAGCRGGGQTPLTLTTALGASASGPEPEVLRVDDPLDHLASKDPWMAEVVQLGPLAARGPRRVPRARARDPRGWLAERADNLVQRAVALNHPNITRLYDAGVTADARPYLTLEYVAGRPIGAYCDDEGLGVRSRVGVFLQVLQAVAYAHARLVLHRDRQAPGMVDGDSLAARDERRALVAVLVVSY